MSETVHSGPGGGPSGRRRCAPAAAEPQTTGGGRAGRRSASCSPSSRRSWSWIGIKAADDCSKFVTVTLNGLTLAALYFVVASGFTLIFGLMRVVNMAHGSLYLLGGYLALNFQQKLFRRTTAA